MLNGLIELQCALKLTFLPISHDLTVVRHMCDEVSLMYLGKIVELCTVQQRFTQPKHPYTQALMGDIPSTNLDQRMLEHVSLEADIISAPWSCKGCRFPPRCPAAQVDECHSVEPPLVTIGSGQQAACHLLHPALNPSFE